MAVLVAQSISPELRKIARFGCVGLVGVVVNTTVLWLLTEHVRLYYLLSSAVATEAAIVFNFILNDFWTFAALGHGEPVFARLAKYNAVALGGLLLTVAALYALTTLFRVPYLTANLAAIAGGTLWNYTASRRWAWRTRPPVAAG
jgi:dolichol-phosphate mannosyltransferase